MEFTSDKIEDYISYAPTQKDKRWLHLAAFLLLLPFISYFSNWLGFIPFKISNLQEYCEVLGYDHLIKAAILLLKILALLILQRLANDRMSRCAMTIGMIWYVFMLIVHVTAFGVWNSFSEKVSDYESMKDSFGSRMDGYIVFLNIIDSCVWVYLFSLLMKNRFLTPSSRSWIGILMVSQIGGIIQNLALIILTIGIPSELLTGDWISLLYIRSKLFLVFQLVFLILLAIGYVKFSHCEVFFGKYDSSPTPRGAFNPFNKYMLALVIGSVVTLSLMWLLYHNAAIFI